MKSYTVPANATKLFILAAGAAGGDSDGPGAIGASISGVVPVTPGETLNVVVGCRGENGDIFAGDGGAGFAVGGGGGTSDFKQSGAGGGGSSGVARVSAPTAPPLLVAGGGGGGGGAGSFASGGRGGRGSEKGFSGRRGGGTNHAGGGGGGASSTTAGEKGWGSSASGSGGGGGGGYPGGGAGRGGSCSTCGGGGGGGGASYIDPAATAVDLSEGKAPSSDGYVVLLPLKDWTSTPSVQVFSCNKGKTEDFKIPSTADNVVALVSGGKGGSLLNDGGRGGDGAQVRGTLSVTPGGRLYVVAGCRASDSTGSSGGLGYGNGGRGGTNAPYSQSGAGGGGGSALLAQDLTPLIIAGGGGGGGGDGSASNAGNGGNGSGTGENGTGGGGSSGGSGGIGGGMSGKDASRGGDSNGFEGGGGGGGGGGYRAGTGGHNGGAATGGGGGGGGSSYTAANVTDVAISNGTNRGTGSVIITAPVASVPDPPTGVSASTNGVTATVVFTPPVDDGGRPVTSYKVISSPRGGKGTGTTSPLTVSDLSPGTTYTFSVVATNAIGESYSSAPSNPVTMPTRPGAPTLISGYAIPGGAAVFFLPPFSDGGSPIVSYTATLSPGGQTITASTPPFLFSGLTKFKTYTMSVRATNVVGTGPASGASNPVTVYDAPAAPTGVSAAAGNGTAVVSFSPPSDDGGSPVVNYTVSVSPGTTRVTGTASPITVPGLVFGSTYTFTVSANTAGGLSSPNSASSNPVTIVGTSVPGAPTNVVVSDPLSGVTTAGSNFAIAWLPPSGLAQLNVAFSPPATDGNSPITSYTVTISDYIGARRTVSGTSSPITVTGLAPNQYHFVVTATNAIGTGPGSSPSQITGPSVVLRPSADLFSGAQSLPGTSGSVTGNNRWSYVEAGELRHAGSLAQMSNWYTVTAPQNGTLTIDTCGSSFDTRLALYLVDPVSGSGSFHNLWAYTSNDNAVCAGDASNLRSRVSAPVTAGRTYYLAVDGSNTSYGDYVVNWRIQ